MMKLMKALAFVLCIAMAVPALATGVAEPTAKPAHMDMTYEEKLAAYSVEYISGRDFFYYEQEDMYVVMFAFLNENEEKIASPCTVDVRLVNSQGKEVYKATKHLDMEENFSTWTWSSALYQNKNGTYGSIYISPEEIKLSKSAEGKMFIKVYLDGWWTFAESEIAIDELPKEKAKVNLPSFPQTIFTAGTRAVRITKVTYELDDYGDFVFKVTGEMYAGSTQTAQSCRIGWRLKDSEGYILDSGTWYTDDLFKGDKFKDKEFTIYGDYEPGEYTLQLIDVK